MMTVERRRSPRMAAPVGTEGVIRSTVHVQISDISCEGVQLQASSPLRPGAMYALQAQLPDLALNTQIRVTRCKAGGILRDAKGAQVLVFSAGAEFVWSGDNGNRDLARWLEGRASGQRRPLRAQLSAPTAGEGEER